MLFNYQMMWHYVDPGTGALIQQLIMAALFGSLFFVKRIRNGILALFGRKPKEEPIEGVKISKETPEDQ